LWLTACWLFATGKDGIAALGLNNTWYGELTAYRTADGPFSHPQGGLRSDGSGPSEGLQPLRPAGMKTA
jgi:hypothetical protein